MDIKATDNNSWGLSDSELVTYGDAVEVVKENKDADYFIMSWSDYLSEADYDVLMAMRENNYETGKEQKLIVIGEGMGGCTGSDKFHNELIEINEEDKNFVDACIGHENFSGLHDYVRLVN